MQSTVVPSLREVLRAEASEAKKVGYIRWPHQEAKTSKYPECLTKGMIARDLLPEKLMLRQCEAWMKRKRNAKEKQSGKWALNYSEDYQYFVPINPHSQTKDICYLNFKQNS